MLQNIVKLRTNAWAPVVVLFLLSCAVYLNTYGNRLTYDDRPLLLEDHRLRSVTSLPALFTHDYFMVPGHNLYRPLPMLSIAVNYLLFGEAVLSYRVVNQLLHAVNVVLLFLFLGNFLPERPGLRFWASALFAVHPAATEAVNIIVYRAELFAFAFTLLAFHLYIRRDRGAWHRYGSLACYFLGMLSKESAMILPLFLLAYHWYFEGGTRKAFAIDMIGYGAAALLVAGGRSAVLGAFGPQEAHQFFYGIPWPATALTMAKAIAYYWKIVLWPADLQMNYDFSDFPVAASLLDARVAASLLFLAAVIALARWLYRRDRTLSFFVLWPFIALLPVMNILVPSGVLIAVRLLYLPMAGYSVVLAAGIALLGPLLARIWGDEHGAARERALLIAVCSSVVLLAVMTLDRNRDFRDSETLFRKDLLLSPDNTLSMRFLAPELPPDEAEALLTRALRLRPDDSLFLSMLGEVYEGRGDHAAAEALQRRSLAIESTYRAHKQLGIVLSSTGRLREAEDEFRKVVELKPYWSDAYEDLAINQYRQGRREEAWELLQKALQLNPGSAGAYNLIGVAYKDGGDFPRAAAAFQRSIALSRQADEVPPQLYEAMFNLADAYEKYDPEAAMRAWTDYLRAAEAAPAEQTWVAEAKTRIAALSRARQDR